MKLGTLQMTCDTPWYATMACPVGNKKAEHTLLNEQFTNSEL